MCEINNIYKLGFDILDQTPTNTKEKVYKPTKEAIHKMLKYVQKCSDLKGATLTFKRKWHDEDQTVLHRIVHEKIVKSKLWKGKKFILFPEFTKKGVVHYHCLFWDIYQAPFVKLIQWWRRTFGFAKMELEIRHPKCYIDYITKDYEKVGLYSIYEFGELNKKIYNII